MPTPPADKRERLALVSHKSNVKRFKLKDKFFRDSSREGRI
jgi:hypothetical protein